MGEPKTVKAQKIVAEGKDELNVEKQNKKTEEAQVTLKREIDKMTEQIAEKKNAGMEALAMMYSESGKLSQGLEDAVFKYIQETTTLEKKWNVFKEILQTLNKKIEIFKRGAKKELIKQSGKRKTPKQRRLRSGKHVRK